MAKAPPPKPDYRTLIALGISQPYASELAAGKKIPSFRLAQRIADATGYPMSEWKLGECAPRPVRA